MYTTPLSGLGIQEKFGSYTTNNLNLEQLYVK